MPVFFSSCRDGVNYFSARLVFALAGFALFPFAVEAAGLGNIRVRSALGERFDAAVTVTAGADESLSAACFQLIEPNGVDDVRSLRHARVDFQRTAQGGEVHILGREHEPEPLLNVALRLRCPEESARGVTRVYSVLLDPREYSKSVRQLQPAIPVVAAKAAVPPRSVIGPSSIWRVRAGETAEQLARRHYPRDAASREQFITDLWMLNADLPQDRNAFLPKDVFLALPPVSKATKARKSSPMPVAVGKPAKEKQAKSAAERKEASSDSKFRLQIASVPQGKLPPAVNLSEEEKLKQRERMLQQETDDQTAQLLLLKNRIAQLEKQIAEISNTASGAAAISSPAQKLSKTAGVSEPAREDDFPIHWLLVALGSLFVGAIGFFVWRRWDDKRKALFVEDEPFSFEPEPSAVAQEGAVMSPGPALHPLASESESPAPVAVAKVLATEEWVTSARMDVVEPETLAEEVSLLMAHGMARQAVDILQQEIKTRPQAVVLWMKLFEGCRLLGDSKLFAAQAQDFRARFLSEAWWQQVQSIGRELDPGNPLYQEDEALAPLMPEVNFPPSLVAEEVPEPRDVLLEFPLEFDSSEIEAKRAGFGELPERSVPQEESAPMFSIELPPLELPAATALSTGDFVSDDPTMQAIALVIQAGQRDEACHQLEELLYRGTFEQQLLAAKWLDKLLPVQDK